MTTFDWEHEEDNMSQDQFLKFNCPSCSYEGFVRKPVGIVGEVTTNCFCTNCSADIRVTVKEDWNVIAVAKAEKEKKDESSGSTGS